MGYIIQLRWSVIVHIEFLAMIMSIQDQINSLGTSDVIWWHRSGLTLFQVMVCRPTTRSHYLIQCWLIIKGVLWNLPGSNFTRPTRNISQSWTWSLSQCIFCWVKREIWMVLLCCIRHEIWASGYNINRGIIGSWHPLKHVDTNGV